MSIELVKVEVAKFLANSEPAVLCLRGRWGVGKTYGWNEQLRKAHAEKRLAILKYSYVSLFGLNSLNDLKYAVFENSQKVGDGIRIPSLETLDEFVGKLPNPKSFMKPFTSGSWVSRVIGGEGVQALSFIMVRNQIVCIDDFERRGKGLDTKDVLGLISFLREQRNCKIALILNDERLVEKERIDFETHLEKVVDVSLLYAPSASQAAAIGAAGESETKRYVRDRCAALGVTNIRTIKRAGRIDRT